MSATLSAIRKAEREAGRIFCGGFLDVHFSEWWFLLHPSRCFVFFLSFLWDKELDRCSSYIKEKGTNAGFWTAHSEPQAPTDLPTKWRGAHRGRVCWHRDLGTCPHSLSSIIIGICVWRGKDWLLNSWGSGSVFRCIELTLMHVTGPFKAADLCRNFHLWTLSLMFC